MQDVSLPGGGPGGARAAPSIRTLGVRTPALRSRVAGALARRRAALAAASRSGRRWGTWWCPQGSSSRDIVATATTVAPIAEGRRDDDRLGRAGLGAGPHRGHA